MTFRFGIVAAAVVMTVASPIRAVQQGASPPQFRARADVVSVAVSVKDGRHPVAGLAAADFEVSDNGVLQHVEAVSLDKLSIDVTLVLTGFRSEAVGEHLKGLFRASEVRELLTPSDRLRIVDVADGVHGRVVGPDFAMPASNDNAMQIPGISVIDGVFYALAWPVDADRRHLVVAFTDGWDTWSTLSADRLPALASHSDAVLHAVFWSSPSDVQRASFGDSPADPARAGLDKPRMGSSIVSEWDRGYRAVVAAVDRTGGTFRPATSVDAFRSILDDFRTSYVLRFTPSGVAPLGWHELKVRVTRSGSFTVRARKGYENQ
jgi:hypothetical protein